VQNFCLEFFEIFITFVSMVGAYGPMCQIEFPALVLSTIFARLVTDRILLNLGVCIFFGLCEL
jgi:hypothetical protein